MWIRLCVGGMRCRRVTPPPNTKAVAQSREKVKYSSNHCRSTDEAIFYLKPGDGMKKVVEGGGKEKKKGYIHTYVSWDLAGLR